MNITVCPKCGAECTVEIKNADGKYVKKFTCTECAFTKEIEMTVKNREDWM